ncbi:hypothetical protein N183_35500 [Sinorhizobium sp. Sb3]|nr:hypothetical protein N183_35500 [Sinorhizobium sp. Sb3]
MPAVRTIRGAASFVGDALGHSLRMLFFEVDFR